MGRVALLSAVLIAVAAPAGFSANAPKWTATGEITVLRVHSITVHGHTCSIPGTLAKFVNETFSPGDGAKIVCSRGVLRRIAVLPLPSVIVTSPPKTLPSNPTATSLSFVVTGGLTVTAAGGGSITVAGVASFQPWTCTTGTSSPDISGLQVGERLAKFACADGVLTSFTTG